MLGRMLFLLGPMYKKAGSAGNLYTLRVIILFYLHLVLRLANLYV